MFKPGDVLIAINWPFNKIQILDLPPYKYHDKIISYTIKFLDNSHYDYRLGDEAIYNIETLNMYFNLWVPKANKVWRELNA